MTLYEVSAFPTRIWILVLLYCYVLYVLYWTILLSSHHRALVWLTLLIISHFIIIGGGLARPSGDALDGHVLTALAMPPFQLLDLGVVNIIENDRPFAATDRDLGAVAGEVEFREEYLRRRGLRCGRVAFKGNGKCYVP